MRPRSRMRLASKGSPWSRRSEACSPEVEPPAGGSEPGPSQSATKVLSGASLAPGSLPGMHDRRQLLPTAGYSLIEVLVVVAILGAVGGLGTLSLCHGVRHQEARGAAQVWQAGSAWTQVGVLWRGGSGRLTYRAGDLSLSNDAALFGGALGLMAPVTPTETNLARWAKDGGISVAFSGTLASPDGGGSISFDSWAGACRVTVRPETGLMVRSWAGAE